MPTITMRKLLLFFLMSVLILCCRNKDNGYVYHEKWVIQNIYDPNSLKGEPQEVKEIFYNDLDDTSLSAPHNPSSAVLYQFDRSGNNIFTRFYFGPASIIVMNCKYGPDGPERRLRSFDSLDLGKPARETWTIAEKIEGDKFKITSYSDSNYQRHHVISFSANGRTVKDETWVNEELIGTITSHHTGERLTKEEKLQEGESSEETYYYSVKGFLDSIVSFDSGKPSGSKIFVNNEQGDVVVFIQRGEKGIEEKRRMRYQYDEKGNWIKQLEYIEIGHLNRPRPDPKFPGYSLTIREIKY
jgi:hypothetical protein